MAALVPALVTLLTPRGMLLFQRRRGSGGG